MRSRFARTLRPNACLRRFAGSTRSSSSGGRASSRRLAHLRDRHSEGVGIGLIAGEAGSGKTRLAARFAVESAALGATVLYGCCAEQALVPVRALRGRDRRKRARCRRARGTARERARRPALPRAGRSPVGRPGDVGSAEPARARPPRGAAARRWRLPGGRGERAALRGLRRPSAQLCRRARRALRPRSRGNGNADRRRFRDERRCGPGARDPRPHRRQPVLRPRAGAPCR